MAAIPAATIPNARAFATHATMPAATTSGRAGRVAPSVRRGIGATRLWQTNRPNRLLADDRARAGSFADVELNPRRSGRRDGVHLDHGESGSVRIGQNRKAPWRDISRRH